MSDTKSNKPVRLGLAGIWFKPFWAFRQDQYGSVRP